MEGTHTDKFVINGLCLTVSKNIVYKVPVEIICSILKWVDEDTLVFSCRSVCKEWKDIVENLVLDEKAKGTKLLLGPRSEKHIPWWISYWIIKKQLFQQNIISNNCGQHDLKHWNIIQNGGDNWIVEKDSVGVMNPFPLCDEIGTNTSCFVTSFNWCSKEQIVALSKFGLSHKIMDEIQPEFECSDWIATRFDCGGVYGLHAVLLKGDRRPLCGSMIDSAHIARTVEYNHAHYNYIREPELVAPGPGEMFAEKRLEAGEGWVKISGIIKQPYPPGARYILFHHRGKDTQFWKGHYGIKITGSLVRPVFPKETYISDLSPSSPCD